MERSRSSVSFANELNTFMIQKDYLNAARHKQSVEYSKKCVYFYEKISGEIEDYYHIIFQLPQKLKDPLQTPVPQQSPQFLKFKTFLKNFFEIFTQLSHFQINQLSKGRSSISEFRDRNYQNFNQSIEKYRALQDEFQQDRIAYKNLCLSIEKQYSNFVNTLKKVEQNFNGKFIKAQYENLLKKIEKKEQLQQQLNTKAEQISANTRKFDKQIMFHRQKLVSFKYSYIEKISRFCSNAKQSLMEVLTYMVDLINQNREDFAINKSEIAIKADLKLADKREIGDQINRCTKDYEQKINKYLFILKALINIFTQISAQIKQEKGRQMEIIEQMNKYFEYNQCNITEVLSTMDLYTIFLKYLSEIGDKLFYSENNFRFLQKNVNKQKQITLTILKCSNNNERKLHLKPESEIKQKQYENNYLQNLFEQMSPVYINNILAKIFHDFEETVIKIREKFLLNQPPSRKSVNNNSMSMSRIYTESSEPQRRPFKCDLWLWREWRKEIIKEFVEFVQIRSMVGELAKYIEKFQLEEKELQKLPCLLSNKKLKGILKLKAHGMLFESNDNSHQYFIPFFKIDSIDMELNIISKTIVIETVHGNLTFINEEANEIKRFYVSAQKAIDYYNENNDEGKVIQQALALSEQEIDFINKRKQEIEKNLQNENDYEHFNTIMVDNVTINDVYRVIFSDNKLVVKGKEHPCFIDTLMKKFNNYNQTYNPFQPQGPEFYTGIKGIDFKNCPLISQRVIQFDHTLPKIPFMPECCHNAQTVKIFWVSHEEFHVLEINNTSGAPYTQNFIITMLSKVTKVAQDVEIRFFIKVKIVHDFSLRKMVVGTATGEAKWGNGILATQIKKLMMGYKRKQGKDGNNAERQENLQDSNLSDKTVVKSYKSRISSLEKKNKLLMYILGGVLLLNVLIKLFF